MTFKLTRARRIGPLAVIANMLLMLLCGSSPADPPPKLDEKRLGHILGVLGDWEGADIKWAKLTTDGEAVLPYIAHIIENPGSDGILDRAFIFARENLTKYDCKRLVEPTVANLTHHRWEIRSEAVWLLRTIGSRADTPPVVAMLYDEDKGVRVCAAGCLEKLGGKREVQALDIWLRNPTRAKDEAFDAVKKSRDALRARVDAEEKAKTEKEAGLRAKSATDKADPKKGDKK